MKDSPYKKISDIIKKKSSVFKIILDFHNNFVSFCEKAKFSKSGIIIH